MSSAETSTGNPEIAVSVLGLSSVTLGSSADVSVEVGDLIGLAASVAPSSAGGIDARISLLPEVGGVSVAVGVGQSTSGLLSLSLAVSLPAPPDSETPSNTTGTPQAPPPASTPLAPTATPPATAAVGADVRPMVAGSATVERITAQPTGTDSAAPVRTEAAREMNRPGETSLLLAPLNTARIGGSGTAEEETTPPASPREDHAGAGELPDGLSGKAGGGEAASDGGGGSGEATPDEPIPEAVEELLEVPLTEGGVEFVPAALGPLADFLPNGIAGLRDAARQALGMVSGPQSGFHLFGWLAGLTTLILILEGRRKRSARPTPATPEPV